MHMPDTDSLDEETKAILASIESDDSKESNNPKKKKLANDSYNTYETNSLESSDEDW